MKAPKVKATLVDTYEDARFEERRWVGEAWQLPADAESYERMVEQMAQKICGTLGYAKWKTASTTWKEIWRHRARRYLRAIGIVKPKGGRK